MPYIGKEPEHGNYQRIDTIVSGFNGSETTFNLRADSASVYPTSPATMIISLGGVVQEPDTSYTVSGDQITFTTAPASGTTFWGVSLGDTLDIGTVADGSITAAKLADDAVNTDEIVDDAVTADKLANSINAEIAANTAKTGITSSQASAITANTAKVTNATHTGDVTGATALTIANGAVDIAHLSASGSAGSGTFLRGDNQWAAVAGIPSGVILMWHGLIANIPSGWVLCNGSNGTPDLRGQFTQGAANGVEAGATGGSATAAPSAHSNHSVTQPSAHAALASHQHSVPLGTGNGNNHNIMIDHNEYGAGNSYSADRRTLNIGVNGNWSTTGTLTQGVAAGTPDSHSGTAVDAHSAHSISDSRPPFYTILYIMKT